MLLLFYILPNFHRVVLFDVKLVLWVSHLKCHVLMMQYIYMLYQIRALLIMRDERNVYWPLDLIVRCRLYWSLIFMDFTSLTVRAS